MGRPTVRDEGGRVTREHFSSYLTAFTSFEITGEGEDQQQLSGGHQRLSVNWGLQF
ncbi:hypothetical protein PAMP_002794 [Pampus punctatissimus]